MLQLSLALVLIRISTAASDFEYARILGNPKLSCGEESLMIDIQTSIAFQGRIYIVGRPLMPACSFDFSANILPNASASIPYEKCLQVENGSNGSKIYLGNIGIGFHPLVVTTSDRVFAVKCVDESHFIETEAENSASCKHLIRHAMKWDGATEFKVGDSVVNEWSCTFKNKPGSDYMAVLSYCSAVSETGKTIHLIDENGCIVDSELMGDLSYSNYQVKIYARAKMFRFLTGERMRFECRLQLCKRGIGGCTSGLIPPKCAFTKDEIMKRAEIRKSRTNQIDDHLKTSLLMEAVKFERRFDVESDWVTVADNEYTDISALKERYILTSQVNHTVHFLGKRAPVTHFLMELSQRGRHNNISSTTPRPVAPGLQTKIRRIPEMIKMETTEIDDIDNMHPDFTAASSESSIEKNDIIGEMPPFPEPFPTLKVEFDTSATVSSMTTAASTTMTTLLSTSTSTTITTTVTKTTTETPKSSSTKINTLLPTMTTPYSPTKSTAIKLIPKAKPTQKLLMFRIPDEKPIWTPTSHYTTPKPATTRLGNIFYTQPAAFSPIESSEEAFTIRTASWELFDPPKVLPFDNLPPPTTTPRTRPPYKVVYRPNDSENDLDIAENILEEKPFEMKSEEMGNQLDKDFDVLDDDKFENRRELWRLDDVMLNDTDFVPMAGAQCSNATVAAGKCHWSAIQNALLVWSFGSLVLWLVLAGVWFYKYNTKKPDWVRRREALRACVIASEHPWVHQDAFVEPKQSYKKEIDLNRM